MEETGPAIRALGHLFKLTQVHLWDDEALDVGGGVSTHHKSICRETVGSNEDCSIDEFSRSQEDLGISRQLSDLGLPLSFKTSKEKRARTTSGKRKDLKKKSLYLQKDMNVEMLDAIPSTDEKITTAASINDIVDSVSTPGEVGLPCPDIAVNTDEASQLSNSGDASTPCSGEVSNLRPNFNIICDSRCLLERDAELNLRSPKLDNECSSGSSMVEDSNDHGTTELYQDPKDNKVAIDDAQCETLLNYVNADLVFASAATVCSQSTEMVDCNTFDSKCEGVFGDWRACWDDYYMRTYFFNVITLDSTWEPPPGVTDVEIPRSLDGSDELIVEIEQSKANFPDSGESVDSCVSCVLQPSLDMAKECIYGNGSCGETYSESREIGLLAEGCRDTASKKKKNKTRKLKFEGILPNANEGGFEEMSPSINKYWFQRYLLFSRFDEGIQMDEEGWFSVTPERIAAHHALRCEGGITIDCFTGVGGNAIQFAKRSQHVIAIDIDPRKIDYARHNAAIYGVVDQIDFVRGDCFLLASLMKADTVFLSPPWGGPDYSKVKTFDMNIMLQPHDGQFVFNIAKKIAPKVVMFLPRNVDVNQLAEIAMSSNPPWSLEVEKNYLNGKLKAITAYFSVPVLEKD